MNIQQNINQTLSIAGMLMSQTPIARAASTAAQEKEMEKRRLKTAQDFAYKANQMVETGAITLEDAVDEQSKKFEETTGKKPTIEQKRQWAEGHAKAQSYLAEQAEAATRELFTANPTKETYDAYARNAIGAQEVEEEKENYFAKLDKEMADRAQEAKLREQRRLANNLYMINRRGTNNGK